MYAITGITGQVGGEVARALLNNGQSVRAVIRDPRKGAAWNNLGCEISLADMNDAVALTAAFKSAQGVFILLPPIFDPSPGFAETRATVTVLRQSLEAARPQKVVCISTIGAQAKQENLLTQLAIMEQSLGNLPMPVAFLRPAWYMENYRWDIDSARDRGVITSFLQPLDKPVPMVPTTDIGRIAAELLQETWTGRRIVELEGPTRVTPNQIAKTFAEIFSRPVQAEAVPRETWEPLFKSQGMKNPLPRMQMLDGFNEGWITFETSPDKIRKGVVPIETILKALADASQHSAAL